MIKVNELRVGNWIDFAGTIAPVTEIDGENIWVRGKIKLPDSTKYPSFPIKRLKGIPLTPDILEKAGFTEGRITSAVYYHKGRNFSLEGHATIKDHGFRYNSLQVKHLHQLQNLYFALTGEELAINM
jgi:hypothetical protein